MRNQTSLLLPMVLLFLSATGLALTGFIAPELLCDTAVLPLATCTILLAGLWCLWVTIDQYVLSLGTINSMLKSILKGKPLGQKGAGLRGVTAETGQSVREVAGIIREAAAFANDMGEGRYNSQSYQPDDDDPLGEALLGMRARLKEIADAEQVHNWSVTGIAAFADLIQESHRNLNELGNRFVPELCHYMGLDLGVLYLLDNKDKNLAHLSGMYAVNGDTLRQEEMLLQGTLLQQVIEDRKLSYVEGLPSGYLKAVSGLGGREARYLLICPVMTPDRVYGVIEVASFHPIETYKREWLEKVCHDLAVKVGSIQSTSETQRLLEQAQKTNDRMREQEDTLLQQASELQQAQKERETQLDRLKDEMAFSRSLTEAIDRTNASLDLDLDGNILGVNEMFLSVMGYTAEELIGKNEMELLAVNDLQGGQYQMMWESLQGGAYFSGEFRKIRKDGGEVWFSGSYSPVLNSQGEVLRIVKFARVISEEKEKAMLVKSQLNAVTHSIASFFLTPQANILSPGKRFIELSGHKRLALKKFTFDDFIVDSSYGQEEWSRDQSRLFEKGEMVEIDAQLRFGEGREGHYRIVLSPVRLLSGKVGKAYGILLPAAENVSPAEKNNQLVSLK